MAALIRRWLPGGSHGLIPITRHIVPIWTVSGTATGVAGGKGSVSECRVT